MVKKKLSDNEDMLHLDPEIPKYHYSYLALTKARSIFINQPIDFELSSSVSALMIYYDHLDPDEDITLYLNSVGGSSAALCNIYDVIRMVKAPVKTVCLGKCYSAAAVLLAAGTKGKRYVFPHSQVMIHGLQCSFPVIGNSSQIDSQSYLEFLNSHNMEVLKMVAKDTGHTFDKIKEDCSKDMYFTAKEAIKYGLADHIVEAKSL